MRSWSFICYPYCESTCVGFLKFLSGFLFSFLRSFYDLIYPYKSFRDASEFGFQLFIAEIRLLTVWRFKMLGPSRAFKTCCKRIATWRRLNSARSILVRSDRLKLLWIWLAIRCAAATRSTNLLPIWLKLSEPKEMILKLRVMNYHNDDDSTDPDVVITVTRQLLFRWSSLSRRDMGTDGSSLG